MPLISMIRQTMFANLAMLISEAKNCTSVTINIITAIMQESMPRNIGRARGAVENAMMPSSE